MHAIRIAVLLLLAGCLSLADTSVAWADTPLPPPAKKEVWSGNHYYCAVMDPGTNLTTVYFTGNQPRKELWSMLGWYRVAFLSGDGEHLVVGHRGSNLLPLNVTDDCIMAYFVRKGEVIATLRLGDLIKNKSSLKRTASHYLWGSYLGIDEDGRFRVETVEGKKLYFDTTTGKPISMGE